MENHPAITEIASWVTDHHFHPVPTTGRYRGARLVVVSSGAWARLNVTPSGEREETLSIPLTYPVPRILAMVGEEIDYYQTKAS